jgi:methyltransferase
MVITLSAYLAIVGALAAERLYELFLSARNARRAFAIGAVEAGRDHYPLMVAFHTLFLGAAAAEAIVLHRPFPGLLGWAALGAALETQALRYWCVATLGPRWNTRIIVWPGLAPVSRGPYRFMRHPNYHAIIVEIACVPLIRECWLMAISFSAGNALLLVQRIRAEEAAMGPRYAREFADRMRFIPLPGRRRLDGRQPRQPPRRGGRA